MGLAFGADGVTPGPAVPQPGFYFQETTALVGEDKESALFHILLEVVADESVQGIDSRRMSQGSSAMKMRSEPAKLNMARRG